MSKQVKEFYRGFKLLGSGMSMSSHPQESKEQLLANGYKEEEISLYREVLPVSGDLEELILGCVGKIGQGAAVPHRDVQLISYGFKSGYDAAISRYTELNRQLANENHRCKEKIKEYQETIDKMTTPAVYWDQKKEISRLQLEIETLRRYGNKDCTAMADEALGKA